MNEMMTLRNSEHDVTATFSRKESEANRVLGMCFTQCVVSTKPKLNSSFCRT